MTRSDAQLEISLREKGFFPFQVHFIEKFLRPDSVRGHLLQAMPGSGVTWTVAGLLQVMRDRGEAKKVLVLARPSVGQQLYSVLNKLRVPSSTVDRYRFRELQAGQAPACPPWDQELVFILGIDFAKQDDISESLLRTTWDLLIVLDSARLGGRRGDLVRALQRISRRLLLTQSLYAAETDTRTLTDFARTTWTLTDLRRWDGTPLVSTSPTITRILTYDLSPQENLLREQVLSLAQRIEQEGNSASKLRGALIRHTAFSSPAAVEHLMQHLRNSPFIPVSENVFEGEDEEEEASVPSVRSLETIALLQQILNTLESQRQDAKLSLLVQAFSDRVQRGLGRPRICIVTRYRSNVAYLSAGLSDLGIDIFEFHGELAIPVAEEALHHFKESGGILIATSILGEGIALPEVELLVLYDIPESERAVAQLYSCFNRIGRTEPLEVWTFQAAGDAQNQEQRGLELLQKQGR